MDGVLIGDERMIAGADRFLARLDGTRRGYLVLTNNSLQSPTDLSRRLSGLGLEVPVERLWTSALATAQFVASQCPGGAAFVMGEDSMHDALAEVGIREDAAAADYVVVGETQEYTFEDFATAVRLIVSGARFVATNPEPTGPSAQGPLPGCGAMTALIERASGVAPYFVGKPNPLMIREALGRLGAHAHSTVLVGDRMDTDVISGIEAGLATILVLSGVTTREDVDSYSYRPTLVVDSVADLVRLVE